MKKNGDSISSDDDDDDKAAVRPVLGDMDRQALVAMRPSRVGRRGSRADGVDLWHGSREGAPVYYRVCTSRSSYSLSLSLRLSLFLCLCLGRLPDALWLAQCWIFLVWTSR